MQQIIDFVKDNIFLVGVGGVAVFVVIILLVLMLKRPKTVAEQQRFNAIAEEYEKRTMKKCKHCSSSIPIDDEICRICNQIPDGKKKKK